MLWMIYTTTNRYNLAPEVLKAYLQELQSRKDELILEDQLYYTDGFHFFKKEDFTSLIEGRLFPFPEAVTLQAAGAKNQYSTTDALLDLSIKLNRPMYSPIYL